MIATTIFEVKEFNIDFQRALPCRIAAAKSLLLMMREHPLSSERAKIIDFFVETIGGHQSCYRRRLLLDIVPALLEHFSREFFIQTFLAPILKMAKDPISNIRLQLCRTLATIKTYLVFPSNDDTLSALDKVISELLQSEKDQRTRQLIQQVNEKQELSFFLAWNYCFKLQLCIVSLRVNCLEKKWTPNFAA